MKSVRFVTFGCKANQYDSQVLREALLRRGLEEQDREAELVVVNTCTVTAEAGRKARQLIRRLNRENPATRVAVTGCLAESEPEVLRDLPGVDWVLGNGDAKRPVNFLRQLGFEADPEELGIPAGITAFAGHTRAFVKIQDGCDKSCAFSIIPSTRGRSRSRGVEELGAEIRGLVEAGHLEVVLCGIHIGHWGLDIGLTLADLVEHLVALEPRSPEGEPLPWRLRLSSIEATEVDDRLVGLMAAHPERIAREGQRLRRICREEGIEQSKWGGRMHFLRWQWPTTAHGWEQAGFNYDSTLGYADRPGFRCGTCHPYLMFDPVAQRPLQLIQRPLIVMECSVIAERYLGLGYGPEALALIQKLRRRSSAMGGQFTLLWHNSHLNESNDWLMYESLISQ